MTDPGPTHPSSADRPYHLNFLWQAYDAFATRVDHKLGWDHLPKLMGLFDLVGIRNVLREHNLFDTSRQPSVGAVKAPEWDPAFEKQRTVDGSWNDLANPTMGMAGTRFGRNVPIELTWPDTDRMLEPNPRTISRRLMTRDELIPATAGNALIASWLQFMIHDWFKHGTSPTDDPWVLELDPDDDWPEPPLQVFRTPPDPTSPPGSDLPPDVPQRQHPLVGRVPDLRQQRGRAGLPPRARGWPHAAGRRASADPGRPGAATPRCCPASGSASA